MNNCSVIRNKQHQLLIQLGRYTGCRLGELLNSSIDLTKRIINIHNSPTFKNKKKTGKIRQIPINTTLYNILEEHTSRMPSALFNFKHPHYVAKFMKVYIRRAGLPDHLHFHNLRHTFITNLIKKGVSIYKVKELAGHADITTTIGYYR